MRLFECQNCGQLLYFENNRCEKCGLLLGHLPDLSALAPAGGIGGSAAGSADARPRHGDLDRPERAAESSPGMAVPVTVALREGARLGSRRPPVGMTSPSRRREPSRPGRGGGRGQAEHARRRGRRRGSQGTAGKQWGAVPARCGSSTSWATASGASGVAPLRDRPKPVRPASPVVAGGQVDSTTGRSSLPIARCASRAGCGNGRAAPLLRPRRGGPARRRGQMAARRAVRFR